MKIIVAIKQVPERDAQVRIDARAEWIEEAGLQFALNESDAYALEEALQLKEKHGGEVIVVTAGPERVGPTIREALAKGADRAIHIDCEDLGARDALGVARLLAEAVKSENADLLLTGLQSDDLGLGQTGVIVAELLGLPHASLILHVEKTDTGLTVKRELEEGRLFDGKKTDLKQPLLFHNYVKQGVTTARGADSDSKLRTFRQKYGSNYEELFGLTKEILERCNPPKS